MASDKKSLSPLHILAILVLGYIGYDYNEFENAADSAYATKTKKVDSLKKNLVALQKAIADGGQKANSTQDLEQELIKLGEQLKTIENSVPTELETSAFIRSLTTESKKIGLNLLSIQPGSEESLNGYAARHFDVEFKGVYPQLTEFLDRIAAFQRPILIEQLEVNSNNQRLGDLMELNGKIKIRVYRYVPGSVDQWLRSKQGGNT